MFERIRSGLVRFFSGRYGSDQLGRFLLILSLVFLVLGWAGGSWIAPWMSVFNAIAYVPLIWCLIRMYSRNFALRRQENAAFLRLWDRFRDREHRYFRCPNCRQTVRVPRGKGKISIRCPKCSERFIRKS